MGLLLQIVSVASICFIIFVTLYFLLVLLMNFIQSKKNKTRNFNNQKDVIIFSGAGENTIKSF